MIERAYLDGNVLAGALGEVFAVDVTAATGRCASCGTSGAIAQTRVYTSGPGLIARCPACGGVVLRLVRGPGRAWLDLRGIICLELAVAGQ
jgi:predicted anti-sigma-YlaC factor YlaD